MHPLPHPIARTRTLSWLRRGASLLAGVLLAGAALADTPGRTVRVGVYQNEPKVLQGSNGQASGILGDLLHAIAEQEGWVLQPVVCEWQACLKALEAGDIDLMPDVAYTDQRATLYDFHAVPALLSWSQIYKRKGVQLNTALDLQGKRIAVLDGSVQEDYLLNQFQAFGIQGTLVPVKSLPAAFATTAAGDVDAAVANRFYGEYQAPRYQLEPTAILFQPSKLFYVTAKGHNADLLQAIDQHLTAWQSHAGSPYFRVLRRWMETPANLSVPHYVWWGLGVLGSLLLLAVAIGLRLRRQVVSTAWDLQSTEARMATILGSVEAYIYIKDRSLAYQYVNRKVADLFGLPAEAIVGKTDADYFDAATVERLRENDLRVLEKGERVEAEETNRSADGSEQRTYLSVKIPLVDRQGEVYALCGISTDITKHKQAEEAIHRLAYYDSLTQLPNRRLLMERVQLALTAHRRDQEHGALLFIDVDNFKDLNDTLGHHMGDQLLCEIAHRLAACTRAEDTLARQGGDEFVVMLQGLSAQADIAAEQTHQVAQKILQQLGAPYLLEGHRYQTSVSIGITLFAGTAVSQEDLLKQADMAMYQAKTDGRNTVRFFNPAMQDQINARTAMEADLQLALARNEFVLYYQPQMNSLGAQTGVEALVRWQHPQHGLVPPGEFIAVAEASGMILPLGRWILETACAQLQAWSGDAERAGWYIAVNVSARQFRQPDFVDQVRSALMQSGARPQLLELELTESQLVDDVENVIAKMQALKAMGVRMSLDDFGTGYSSLSILQRLPLDKLKIDQSFVGRMLTSAQDSSIIRAVITLGESVGLQVIAEGVETEAQRQALIHLGCTHFQGYLFGRPQPL